jgi:putative spermidine/putrescine transport system permease protein
LENDAGHFSFYAIEAIPSETGFSAAFFLSLRLAAVTTVLAMVLMVPTATYVHLKLPRLRRLLDFITILPIVIPPIVLILGVLHAAPLWLRASPYLLSLVYVILALPFVYRSLDAGLSAIDLKTLVEASRSLGGKWVSTLIHVIIPNLRAALLSATVLTIALVLGEFTMASLDLWTTLPVWIYQFSQKDAHIATAVSMLSLVGTWLLLTVIVSIDRSHSRRARRRTGTL